MESLKTHYELFVLDGDSEADMIKATLEQEGLCGYLQVVKK